MSIFIVGIKK